MKLWQLVLISVFTMLTAPITNRFGIRLKMLDNPNEASRKKHTKITPRTGGLIMLVGFVFGIILINPAPSRELYGLFAGVAIVMCVGLVDDHSRLSGLQKLPLHILAAVVMFGSGVRITFLSNPFGNIINFSMLASLIVTVLWLIVITETFNFLDGVDGLLGGVAVISGLVIWFLSSKPGIDQTATATVAAILVSVVLGFLVYNLPPAKIFNGDGGAYMIGMMLAGLAVFSGAKLATAALVLGLPLIDTATVIIRRMIHGKNHNIIMVLKSAFEGDRTHLQLMLVDIGLKTWQVLAIYYLFAMSFGVVALIGNTRSKFWALTFLILSALTLINFITHKVNSQKNLKK